MKFIVLFLCTIAGSVASVTEEDPPVDYTEGDRFFYFPDGDGKLHLVDSLEPVDEEYVESHSSMHNTHLLYTRFNPYSPQFLILGDENGVLNNSFFDPTKVTVFFAHGWHGNGYSRTCQIITEAFLQNEDVNVIQLDWSQIADQGYLTAKHGIPKVGKEFGEFIAWLTSLGLNYENIHLIGFSLGAHLVGNIGRANQGQIRRITALDPAGPLWSFIDSNRIVQSDGQYVEVIHTNGASFGYRHTCGDADFYPNGGMFMPGCYTNGCSHDRAVEYLASTVKFNHLNANECNSSWEMMFNNCRGSLYPMGNSDLSKSRSGIFRVNTGRDYPF